MRSFAPPRSGAAGRKPADRSRRAAAPTRAVPAARQAGERAGSQPAAPRPDPSAPAGAGALPERLRTVIEAMSGFSLADVVVHRNSAEPARLHAAAFTRGNRIHLGPGQERHLPHEAWHAVQQKQGRVSATRQFKGAALNDESTLEREADAIGARAAAMSAGAAPAAAGPGSASLAVGQGAEVVQRTAWELTDGGWESLDGQTDAMAPSVDEADVGMVYDDQTNRLYWNRDYWQLFATALPEDDVMDADYVDTPIATSDADDDEILDDQTSATDTSVSNANQTEMDLEARRKIDSDRLLMPLTSSLLTAPDARFKSRTIASTDKFKVGKVMGQRTKQAGAVSITLQSVGLWVNDKPVVRDRPVKVVGIVDPTTTTGRGGAPDPLSGYQIYSGEGSQPKLSIQSERNTGATDAERGHIMALELGGPDIPENIVPQWAKFQGSGDWRKMEVSVLGKARALNKGQQLRYTVEIFYKSSGTLTPTLRTFGFPTGFKATTQVIEGKNEGPVVVEFYQGQAQDQTDQMLAERKMSKLEGADWDASLDREKPGKKKRVYVKKDRTKGGKQKTATKPGKPKRIPKQTTATRQQGKSRTDRQQSVRKKRTGSTG